MGCAPNRACEWKATSEGKTRQGAVLARGSAALLLTAVALVTASAQQPATPAASLLFDKVAVVDVEQGKLIPNQRVVIAGNRIQTVGDVDKVQTPKGARVVDAGGKYLIPGLWDMHSHLFQEVGYSLLLANGVTGFRDAGSPIPLATLQQWRREVLAGTRAGPPRQLLSAQSVAGPEPGCDRRNYGDSPQTCVTDSADAVHYVDSLKAAGAEMIKPRAVSRELYFIIAAEARRLHIPFGGHLEHETAIEASDSGASIVDHSFYLGQPCASDSGSVEACRQVAEHFRRNGTWWVPTCIGVVVCGGPGAHALSDRYEELMDRFMSSAVTNPYAPDSAGHNVLQGAMPTATAPASPTDLYMGLKQAAGIPFMAGTDVVAQWPPAFDQVSGFALHAELAMDVAEGLAPLAVLQSATLNPAKFLHATDSLGTVATGKLADLVLLDANPLAQITNTTTIRAVVANGRYFDRGMLDSLLREVQKAKKP